MGCKRPARSTPKCIETYLGLCVLLTLTLFLNELFCVFCFLCVFEQAETVKSIRNTAQAIKNRGCRKSTTNRSGARFGMDLGVILGDSLVTNVCFC